MPLTIQWRPNSAHYDFYKRLENEKFISGSAYLFGIALTLGVVLQRRSTNSEYHSLSFYALNSYGDHDKYPMYLELVNYAIEHFANGNNEREKLKDLERIADGGIEFLIGENENNNLGHLDVTLLLQKVKKLLGSE